MSPNPQMAPFNQPAPQPNDLKLVDRAIGFDDDVSLR